MTVKMITIKIWFCTVIVLLSFRHLFGFTNVIISQNKNYQYLCQLKKITVKSITVKKIFVL